MDKFLGVRYPLVTHPRGYFSPQSGVDQIKSDLLALLLTNKNERVMLTDYGTGLNELFFEPGDAATIELARQKIISAITAFEPRITVDQIIVTTDPVSPLLDPLQDQGELDQILYIQIRFLDPENIQQVQELRLELPIGTS